MFSLDVFAEAVVLSSIVTTDVTGEGLVLVFLSSVMSEGDLVNCHEVAGVTGVADPLMDGLDMLVQMTLTLAREPALVAEISLAPVPVLSLDVNPQLELVSLELASGRTHLDRNRLNRTRLHQIHLDRTRLDRTLFD